MYPHLCAGAQLHPDVGVVVRLPIGQTSRGYDGDFYTSVARRHPLDSDQRRAIVLESRTFELLDWDAADCTKQVAELRS